MFLLSIIQPLFLYEQLLWYKNTHIYFRLLFGPACGW